MKPETRKEIERCAIELAKAYSTALEELGSYNGCQTCDERDQWINLVANLGNLRRWIPEDIRDQFPYL